MTIRLWGSKLCRSFCNLLYPPLCLHCGILIHDSEHHLCSNCLKAIELINFYERCPRCFSVGYEPNQKSCPSCMEQECPFEGIAAAFDYIGPASTLVRQLKYANQPYLAKGAAAFMAAQLLQLPWPLPELIVPMPISLSHRWQRGYNQSALLGLELAKLLAVPISMTLNRSSGDYSQAKLDSKYRNSFTGETFGFNKGTELAMGDKVVLLIDDVMTTVTTLRQAAKKLMEACPAGIYGFTFCRAIL